MTNPDRDEAVVRYGLKAEIQAAEGTLAAIPEDHVIDLSRYIAAKGTKQKAESMLAAFDRIVTEREGLAAEVARWRLKAHEAEAEIERLREKFDQVQEERDSFGHKFARANGEIARLRKGIRQHILEGERHGDCPGLLDGLRTLLQTWE